MIQEEKDKNRKRNQIFDPGLLDKFYRGECRPEERDRIERWFIGLDHRKEINRKAEEVWDKTPETGKEKTHLQEILYKIHYELRLEEYRKEKARRRTKRLRRMIASAAAVIVLVAAGLWFGYMKNGGVGNVYSELHAPYGSRVRFELPDGSSGWLNSGSSLKYPVRFRGMKRMVTLQGEAYFDVKHNSAKPFIVQTGSFRVIALGTSFNVQAYHDVNDEEITLVQGKVVIERKMPDNTYRHLLIMKPDEHVVLDAQTGKINEKDLDAGKYVAWKDGKLIFRNDPLDRVVKEMERFYNVDIEVKDAALNKYHFHATFEDETLFEALRLLTISTPMQYEICKREKNPDGTYKKRKVILYQKKI